MTSLSSSAKEKTRIEFFVSSQKRGDGGSVELIAAVVKVLFLQIGQNSNAVKNLSTVLKVLLTDILYQWFGAL
jgi:hypothetical protein